MTEYGLTMTLKDKSIVNILVKLEEHNSGDIGIKAIVDSTNDGIMPLGSIVFKHNLASMDGSQSLACKTQRR